jgi:hypothetical protein
MDTNTLLSQLVSITNTQPQNNAAQMQQQQMQQAHAQAQQQKLILQQHLAKVLSHEEKEQLKQLGIRAKSNPQDKQEYTEYLTSLMKKYPMVQLSKTY